MKKPYIIEECEDCNGRGLYSGFCEAKGEAVVCLRCDGKGWVAHYYTEWTGRKRKAGIKTIKESRGSFLATGVGGVGQGITYKEFEEKYPNE